MKYTLRSLFVFATLSLAACHSGNPGSRTDYSAPSFDPLQQRIADRAKVIRSLNPKLTEAESINDASMEFSAERLEQAKRNRAKKAQDKFEVDLAKSVAH
jgi:hypothetical protein